MERRAGGSQNTVACTPETNALIHMHACLACSFAQVMCFQQPCTNFHTIETDRRKSEIM